MATIINGVRLPFTIGNIERIERNTESNTENKVQKMWDTFIESVFYGIIAGIVYFSFNLSLIECVILSGALKLISNKMGN